MSEVKRSDSLNLDHYIDYLEKNGLVPKGNIGNTFKGTKKNVVGFNVNEIPAMSNNNIILKEVENGQI